MANSVDLNQTAPIGAVCSRSTLFASILNLLVMLGNYLQQMTSADNIFRCIFSWRFKGQSLSSQYFCPENGICFYICCDKQMAFLEQLAGNQQSGVLSITQRSLT